MGLRAVLMLAVAAALVLGALITADARYLPTRRSQDDRLDRLRELLKDVTRIIVDIYIISRNNGKIAQEDTRRIFELGYCEYTRRLPNAPIPSYQLIAPQCLEDEHYS
ncbi:hypothetical protein LSTR_LSTR013052 [Laodelphax striatellus]|uniref:Uncharacterized protein n=1 Tax=Laodelphax striatellus TaxID=195883 RepID=A0A482XDG3_LAOST|nr:hypothetical protein LSTR_LSTR013052 [Laodelphax striatellus]